MRTFIVILAALWSLAAFMVMGPAGAWARPDLHHAGTPGPVATAPFVMTRLGQICVQARLTGAGTDSETETFIVDSGAGSSLISQSLVDKLGLVSQPAMGSGGQPLRLNGQPVREVTVPGLTIGGLGVGRIPFLVVDDKSLSGISGEPVGGFLGGNLFANVAVLLDFHALQMTFFDHGFMTAFDVKSVNMENAQAVPLTPIPGKRWLTAPVTLHNGTKSATENLVVDTGCVTTVLSHQSADAAGLTGPMGWRGHRTVATASGPLPVLEVMAPSVALGAAPDGIAPLSGVIVAYPDGALPADMAETLGLNVLSHFRVLLDFPGEKLYLAGASASK